MGFRLVPKSSTLDDLEVLQSATLPVHPRTPVGCITLSAEEAAILLWPHWI